MAEQPVRFRSRAVEFAAAAHASTKGALDSVTWLSAVALLLVLRVSLLVPWLAGTVVLLGFECALRRGKPGSAAASEAQRSRIEPNRRAATGS
jgi:hypothetical protein